jgi:hypothetical protein
MLPNGEVYPQNLFEKIKDLFAQEGADEIKDLVGIAALQYITGALPFEARPPKILCRSDDSAVARDGHHMIRPTLDPIDPRVSTSHQPECHHKILLPPDAHAGHPISISTANARTTPDLDIQVHELLVLIDLLPRWDPLSDHAQDAYRSLLHTDQTIVDKLYALKFAQTPGFSEENNSESPASRSKLTWGMGKILGRGRGGNNKTKDNLPKSQDESGKSVHNRTTSSEDLDHNGAAYGTNEPIRKMPTVVRVPATEGSYSSGKPLVPSNSLNGGAVVSRDPRTRRSSSETLQLCGFVLWASETKFKKLNRLLSPVQRNDLKHARRLLTSQSENLPSERTLRLKLLEGAETLLANALEKFWKGSHGPEWTRIHETLSSM